MQRTKFEGARASLIITGDLHIREDTPTCRTDDYWNAQQTKIDFIRSLQQYHRCPVIQPGDFFDHWKPSPRLLAWTFLHMPHEIWTIYGNHDLPQHSIELKEKCGLYAIKSGAPDKVHIVDDVLEYETYNGKPRHILVLHTPVYGSEVPEWHSDACTAQYLLRQHPECDLIITGDVHQKFIHRYKNQLLINAGSMMRMTADQADFEPAVFLWYAKDNSVKEIKLPIEVGVVSREHIERQEERTARYEAFIARLKQEGQPELSFKMNLDRHFQANKTLPSVRDLIYTMLEKE